MISSVSTLAKLKFIPTRTSVIEYFVDASLFKSRSMIGFFVELSSLLLSKEYRDKPRITNEFTQGFILVFRKLLHVEIYGIPINKKKKTLSHALLTSIPISLQLISIHDLKNEFIPSLSLFPIATDDEPRATIN